MARAPIPPSQKKGFVFAGRGYLSRPRPLLARRREVLRGIPSPQTIAVAGNGSGPTPEPSRSGSSWWSLMVGRSLPSTWFGLSPRFYSQLIGPASPLPDGVPRLVGRCYLGSDLKWTKRRSAVSPIATVMLKPDASQCFPLHAAIVQNR